MKIDNIVPPQVKEQFFTELLNNFKAMPKWLRVTLIITVTAGVLYFGFIQKQVVYLKENKELISLHKELSEATEKLKYLEHKTEDVRILQQEIDVLKSVNQGLILIHRHQMRDLLLFVRCSGHDPRLIRELENNMDKHNDEFTKIMDEAYKNRLYKKVMEKDTLHGEVSTE